MQKINTVYLTAFLCFCAWIFSSCSNTKHLPENESLYLGSSINIQDKEAKKKERKFLKTELGGAAKPKPNRKFLGMRIKLAIYNLAGEPKKDKGFRYWLRNKVGEPPVLGSSVNIKSNEQLMENIMDNRGFFFGKARGELVVKNKKSRAKFNIITGPQYTIRNTDFKVDTSAQIARDIVSVSDKTLLKPGAPYNLDLIKGERLRIEKVLKDRGYYYFKPDYLFIEADTTVGNHQVDFALRIKRDSVPENAYNVYKLNQIFVFTNYSLNRSNQDTNRSDAAYYKGLHIVDRRHKYRPFILRDMILFDSGSVYDRSTQNTTINRFINLNTFKFVKNRFDDIGDSLLDVTYYLSAFPKKSLRFEIGANTQNDSRAGSTASISWRNRNTFRGAEELLIKVNGGFETQYTGITRQPAIYTLGGQVGLSFPYFIVPFFHIPSNSSTVPRTIVKATYGYESQEGLLRINTYKLSYGYDWKETIRKEHQLYPININYVKTDSFRSIATNATYANLLFDGLIIGPTYEFTYNSQIGSSSPDNYYFDGLMDFSGIVLGTVQKADYETNPKEIFGQNYAQYAKFQTDFRYFHRIGTSSNVWANRVLVGAGIPFGNSNQLPNIKQFFSGGNSSLRGFRSRLVGPGTFNEKYLDGKTTYIQTLGDLKLELNTELRVKVINFFNVGLFVDAGNIWLYNDNPAFPGGKFSSRFLRELAADAGLGLRFDFKILLLRFDAAIPIRKPWLPEGDRWVFKQIEFGSPEWRSDNLIFNLAIGYPF